MQGQEHVGALGGLLLRLARFLGGDPAQWIVVTATFGNPIGLPDNTNGMSCVLTVTGQPCTWRMDGTAPVAGDPVLPVGTIITITGRPSIQSFRFATTSIAPSILVGSYYD